MAHEALLFHNSQKQKSEVDNLVKTNLELDFQKKSGSSRIATIVV
jgi:hypothetical protein